MNNNPFYIPEAEELLKKLKNQPSDKDRLAAVETAIADLAILLSQNLDNEENV